MSWPIRVQDSMIITTGDGSVFTPLYVRLSRQREYNITEFNFPGLDGTFADRRRPRGIKYQIEVVFSGENHLDEAQRFDGAALDSRPWTVEHPLYGRLRVQPASLEFDDRNYNVTRITSTVVETNEQPGLIATVSAADQVNALTDAALGSGAQAFAQKPATASSLTRNNQIYRSSAAQIITITDAEGYTNLFNDANAAANGVASDATLAIVRTQNLILAPARFQTNLQNRLSAIQTQLQALFGNAAAGSSVPEKILFENSAGALLSAMCVAAINPLPGNYTTVDSVFFVIDQIVLQTNAYIEILDELSTDNNGAPDSYIPDFEFISGLIYLIDYTVSNLIQVGLNAQQERFVFLKADTNIIELAHVYYPDAELDTALGNVISANGWGLNMILGVPAGKKFVYYAN